MTSFKRSPLLSGRGHLLQSPSDGISIVFTCITVRSALPFPPTKIFDEFLTLLTKEPQHQSGHRHCDVIDMWRDE